MDLLLEGHKAHLNVAKWISGSLDKVHRCLPGGVEEILENRPECWEADHIRQLIGQPTYFEQMYTDERASYDPDDV